MMLINDMKADKLGRLALVATSCALAATMTSCASGSRWAGTTQPSEPAQTEEAPNTSSSTKSQPSGETASVGQALEDAEESTEQQENAQIESEPDIDEVEAQEGLTETSDLEFALDEMSKNVEPKQFSGTGDDVINLPYKDTPVLFRIDFQPEDEFGRISIAILNSGGELTDVLVNNELQFSGVTTTWDGFKDADALQVTAQGSWTIDILPMNQATKVTNGETVNGNNVVMVTTNDISKITFDYPEDGYFNADAIGMSKTDTLVYFTKGPYHGTVAWNDPECLIVVQTEGDWTISWE